MTDRPLALPFPLPNGPELSAAYKELYLVAHGDDATKKAIGDPGLLPRPWDPPTCRKRELRQELWQWLDAVVIWFNTEYTWDPTAGMIPPCWPQHPHLVHEIAVLADQRRRAGIDTSSNTLEEWHRYTVPAFLDRLRQRVRSHCDEHHQPWPAKARYFRHIAPATVSAREHSYGGDSVRTLHGRQSAVERPESLLGFFLVDEESGQPIDPCTGEVG